MNKVILTEQQESLLTIGNSCTVKNSEGEYEEYYYIPYYFKRLPNSLTKHYEVIFPEQLPNHIKDIFNNKRNENRNS